MLCVNAELGKMVSDCTAQGFTTLGARVGRLAALGAVGQVQDEGVRRAAAGEVARLREVNVRRQAARRGWQNRRSVYYSQPRGGWL